MTMTINETNETTTDQITVHDIAGLEALPTGTELRLAADHLYLLKTDEGFSWSRGGMSGAKCGATLETMQRGYGWLPATVVNPEVFGEFYKPNPFKVGDRVVKTTVEHFIAQGNENRDYAETEAPQGATGRVTSVDRIWKGVSLHVEWDHGRGSVISPDNLSFVPQYGDKVRIVKADGALDEGVGTFVPRHRANLADYDGYEDHPFAVEVEHFTYLVQIVEVIEQSDLFDWERELLYPVPVVEEEPAEEEVEEDERVLLYAAGDSVTIDYGYDSDNLKWSGPGVVTQDYFEGDYCVNVFSFSRGLLGGFFAKDIIEKHDPEEFTIPTFVVGDEVRDEASLDLLPNNTVIVIGNSNGYIARTKVSGKWGWPSGYAHDLDHQDSMTRQQVVSSGATIKHLGADNID